MTIHYKLVKMQLEVSVLYLTTLESAWWHVVMVDTLSRTQRQPSNYCWIARLMRFVPIFQEWLVRVFSWSILLMPIGWTINWLSRWVGLVGLWSGRFGVMNPSISELGTCWPMPCWISAGMTRQLRCTTGPIQVALMGAFNTTGQGLCWGKECGQRHGP